MEELFDHLDSPEAINTLIAKTKGFLVNYLKGSDEPVPYLTLSEQLRIKIGDSTAMGSALNDLMDSHLVARYQEPGSMSEYEYVG